ncbi:MAG: hypothetical protein JXB35_18095, partial [Anaerolineae bacterium]|nr:hypothetical protein [Anaerolineae bacterium]
MKTSIRKQIKRLIVLVALLGFWTLALHQLGVPSLWYDELFNADLVLGHDVSSIVRVLRFEQPYPPLYYGFLKGWTWLLDVQGYRPGIDPSTGIEFLLRFPSVAAGLIGLAVLAPLGRRVRLPGAAGLPLLLAWHPTFLWYARDARMYAIWLVWAMVALYALAARRKWLWSVSAAAALLTHYFSLFPLAGGALVAWLLERREPDGWGSFLKPRALLWIGSPFVALLLWGWVASRVTFGFASFGTAFPPTPGTFLEELGPDLLTARTFLRTLNGAPSLGLGYGLLLLAALGWLVLVSRAPRRAGILVGALVLGSVLTFVAWQLRPVQHVRYLVWALPLWALGLAALWTVPMARMRYPRAGLVGWLVLAAAGLIWCGAQSLTLLQAPRT